MVTLDCGAVPHGLVPDALFGHRRGAFTGAVESTPGLMEQADQGTLFLDELASLSLEGQAALLRALETGELRRVGDSTVRRVSTRLIGAVQQDVELLLQTNRLRADLYHRLAGGLIQLLPLRDRPEDLWLLAIQFAQTQGRTLSSEAQAVLERYSWPGNARELRHVIQRAAWLQLEQPLSAMSLAEAIDLGGSCTGADSHHSRRDEDGANDRRAAPIAVLADRRAELVRVCLDAQGDRRRAARILGISVATLYRRLRTAGLTLGAFGRDRGTIRVFAGDVLSGCENGEKVRTPHRTVSGNPHQGL
jgi:DNA-binding NtrC family response regulator